MSFTESIAAARAFAERDEPLPEPNRELFALGLANVGGGVLGAMPAGGGTSQTAINRLAGARSQAAELVTAAAARHTAVLLRCTRWMPQAALAAVVIGYSLELIQPKQFLAIRRVRTTEFRWSFIAFAGVILLGTLKGIVVAVIVSMLSLAYQAYNPPLYAVARKRGTAVFRPRSGASRRRELARPAAAADRGAPVLRECAAGRRPRHGPSSNARGRRCS